MTDYIFPEKTMTSHTGLAEFIEEHFDDNTDRLLLGKSKWPDIDMALAVSTILGHRKLRTKVPSWYRNPGLIFPTSLSVEQCSSEFTAEAKVKSFLELLDSEADMRHSQAAASPDKTDTHQTQAEVPLGKDGYSTGTSRKEDNILTGMKIADLTGGLGVDSYVFSRHFGAVLYNEMNPVLAEAAGHNFQALGCDNITVRCNTITSPGSVKELLADFAPDVIYLDPARRAADGRKVFRLKDCQPDILTLKDGLLSMARLVTVKLSPMADTDVIVRELGPHCRRIDVVSRENECRELVIWLDRNFNGECVIHAKCSGKAELGFLKSEEAGADASLLRSPEQLHTLHVHPQPRQGENPLPSDHNTEEIDTQSITSKHIIEGPLYLLEPDKALLKAGAFKILCGRFGLKMLDRSTHYYIADSLDGQSAMPLDACTVPRHANGPETSSATRSVRDFFRIYRIVRVLSLDRTGIRAAAKEFPSAEVTARNIPMSSEELRRKLGARPSDRYHIFGLRVSFRSAPSANCLFVTVPLP